MASGSVSPRATEAQRMLALTSGYMFLYSFRKLSFSMPYTQCPSD